MQARILPKTLFGQKYVELVTPDNTGPQKVATGSTTTIPPLKGGRHHPGPLATAIEIEQLYDNLLPFLTRSSRTS